jgi:antibiotic biosynthesis monooxygenase (ABM) superfamily enzyme
MKKSTIWKFDLAVTLVVIVGFQIIDNSLRQLAEVPFYYDFLQTAKWLLIGGFTLHGLFTWFFSRNN